MIDFAFFLGNGQSLSRFTLLTKGWAIHLGPHGDGIAVGWLGHPVFRDKEGHELFVRRMSTFFETFPVVLVDEEGIVRADVPFRRAESKYSVEQVGVTVEFYGGKLNEVSYSDPATYSLIDENKMISNFDSNIMLEPFHLNWHFLHHDSWEETLTIIHLGQFICENLCLFKLHIKKLVKFSLAAKPYLATIGATTYKEAPSVFLINPHSSAFAHGIESYRLK
ncbi:hypothetical protein ACJX0J_020175 [Zea mays]